MVGTHKRSRRIGLRRGGSFVSSPNDKSEDLFSESDEPVGGDEKYHRGGYNYAGGSTEVLVKIEDGVDATPTIAMPTANRTYHLPHRRISG